jgi:ABC-type branched-subunit amino acid transport system permease subunit
VSDLISYVIRGLPFGCVFGLVAIGLVLTYKTAGVFNLAFGAQAFLSAAVYYDTRVRHEWPIIPAALVAIVVVGPLTGFLLDRALFRYLRTAPPIPKLVTSLGLLVAGPELVAVWFGHSPAYGPASLAPNPDHIYRFGQYALYANELWTIVITVLAVLALGAMFRWSAIGLRMRAVVESPRMTELSGINADRVSTFSWMLSSLFAALAGVLVAPLFAQVTSGNFTTLLVAAIAAAAFGRLTSIPLTLLGGLLLGILQGVLAGYLPANSILANGLRPSLPFVTLFLLLLLWPGLRTAKHVSDPLSGVDPPPPMPVAVERTGTLTRLTWGFGLVAAAVGLWLCLGVFDSYWLSLMTQGVIFGVIFLSLTVITGMGGQVSLCQATFAGIGAFSAAQLVEHYDLSVLVAIAVGTLIAAAVGGLLAIPALRLGGIYLSLATLAFALFFDSVMVPLKWVSGGSFPIQVPRPLLGPFDFASDKSFFVLCAVILALVGTLVVLVRQGTTGRYLDALRGSEVAAAAIGISPARARITAFALSAGIAGLGGGLLACQQGQANSQAFSPFIGLFWVVLVVTLGARSVNGAVNAGISLMVFPQLLKWLGLGAGYQFIFFGLGAITYARHPEGIIEFQTRKSVAKLQQWLDRRAAKQESRPPPPSAPATPEPVGGVR